MQNTVRNSRAAQNGAATSAHASAPNTPRKKTDGNAAAQPSAAKKNSPIRCGHFLGKRGRISADETGQISAERRAKSEVGGSEIHAGDIGVPPTMGARQNVRAAKSKGIAGRNARSSVPPSCKATVRTAATESKTARQPGCESASTEKSAFSRRTKEIAASRRSGTVFLTVRNDSAGRNSSESAAESSRAESPPAEAQSDEERANRKQREQGVIGFPFGAGRFLRKDEPITEQRATKKQKQKDEYSISRLRRQLLAAARSRRGSDSPPDCHSLPRRRFATSRRKPILAVSVGCKTNVLQYFGRFAERF